MRTIYIKNLTDSEKDWGVGKVYSANEEFLIPDIYRLSNYIKDDFLVAVANKEAQVGNGVEYLEPIDAQISWLKGDTQEVEVTGEKSSDTVPLSTIVKSYSDSSKSFTTPDFSNRQTWFWDYTQVTDEIMTTTDNILYSSTRTPNENWNHDWLNWQLVPNHVRQTTPEVKVVVKKNDEVIASGFTINYTNGTITFDAANNSGDVIKVSYRYGNSSRFDLTALEGKKLLVDYIETQFSVGCGIPSNCKWVFKAIYNGPAVAAMGIPANTDVILKSYEYYSAKDFLNESNQAYTALKFMELNNDVNILPWNYLTGHTIKSAGDTTTDISKNEFNKLRIQLVDINGGDDPIVPDCEIATGTVYCLIKDV
jgi:hypothetical protein